MRLFASLFLALSVPCLLAASVRPNPSSGSDFFRDDLAALEREFAGMAALEKKVAEDGATLTQLQAKNDPNLTHLRSQNDLAESLLGAADPRKGSRDDRYKGIPGFLWGFCLPGIGVYLVHRNIANPEAKKRETRHAWVGLVFFGLFTGAVYILLNYSDGLAQ